MNNCILIVLCFLYSVTATAADQHTTSEPFLNQNSVTASFHWGQVEVDEEPQFVSVRNKDSYAVGFHVDLNKYPNLGLDVEFAGYYREYDNSLAAPLFGTIDKDTKVSTDALLFGARVFIPAKHSFRAYASAGIGYFKSSITVYGSIFGLPASHEDTDQNLSLYHGAGLQYMFNNWGISLDYRRFNLKGDFPDFNIKNANIGGDVVLLGWHIHFK